MENNTPENERNTPPPDTAPGNALVREALAETVREFVSSQLGLHPSAIFVDYHGTSITITLKGVLSDSERHAAKDKRTAELIARALTEAFRSVSGILTANCSACLGGPVEDATFILDPRSNYASIILPAAGH